MSPRTSDSIQHWMNATPILALFMSQHDLIRSMTPPDASTFNLSIIRHCPT